MKKHVKQEMAYNKPRNRISHSQLAGVFGYFCLLMQTAKHFLLLYFLSLSIPLISTYCIENMN